MERFSSEESWKLDGLGSAAAANARGEGGP
jgi:hypothetical protein